MGSRLIKEVYDHAPRDLSTAEMNVLLAVAWSIHDDERTRETKLRDGQNRLMELTRMDDKQLGRAFQKLEERGLCLRVQMRDERGHPRYRRDGQPLYATRGHVAVLRLPRFAPVAQPVDNPPRKTPDFGGHTGERPPKMLGKTPENGAKDPRFRGSSDTRGYQEDPDLRASPDLAAVIEAVDKRTGKKIQPDHAERVLRQILEGRTDIRRPGRYAATAIANDPNPSRFLPTQLPPPFRRHPDQERP